MTKYEIYTDTFEFRFGTYKASIPEMTEGDILDEYLWQSSICPKLESSFENLDMATAFFRENYADYGKTWAEKGNCFWLLRGRLAWLEASHYDDDGEFDYGEGTICHSIEGYTEEEEEE